MGERFTLNNGSHLWLTLMTKTYRGLLWGLHKAGNGVPDFNTALHAVSGYRILHNIMSSIYILHTQLSKSRRENKVWLSTISSERKFRCRASSLDRSDARYIEIVDWAIIIGVFHSLVYRKGDGHQSNVISSGDWNMWWKGRRMKSEFEKRRIMRPRGKCRYQTSDNWF